MGLMQSEAYSRKWQRAAKKAIDGNKNDRLMQVVAINSDFTRR